MKKLLLLSLLALPIAAGPIAGGACDPGTLTEYIALLGVGCTSGDVRLFDITYTPSAGGTATDDILVALSFPAPTAAWVSLTPAAAWTLPDTFSLNFLSIKIESPGGSFLMSDFTVGNTSAGALSGSAPFPYDLLSLDASYSTRPGSVPIIVAAGSHPTLVPEPSTYLLAAGGLAACIAIRKRHARRA
jgi:hypothetical protein